MHLGLSLDLLHSPKRPKCCFFLVKRPDMRALDRSNGKDFYLNRKSKSFQKNPRVRKILVRNSGAGNGCANFMGA